MQAGDEDRRDLDEAAGAANIQAGGPGGISAVMRSSPRRVHRWRGGQTTMAKKAKGGKKKGGKKR